MLKEEYWKDVPNYEGRYRISNYGRVQTLRKNKERVMKINSYFGAYKDNNTKEVLIVPIILKELFPKEDIMYLKKEEDFDLEGEIWKDIKGYENCYQISNYGRVKSKEKFLNSPNCKRGIRFIPEKMIHTRIYNSGHLRASLHSKEGSKTYLIHRLVAEAFIPKVEGKDWINHKDCNKTNNCVENLEWCTPSENIKHAFANGRMPVIRGEDKPNALLTEEQVIEIRRLRKETTLSQEKLALMFNVKRGCIKAIVENKSWKYLL